MSDRPRVAVDRDLLWTLMSDAAVSPDATVRADVAALVAVGTAPVPPRRSAVSIAEAAELTGLSRRTVERRIADGTLPHRRLGRRVLIDPAALTDSSRQQPS